MTSLSTIARRRRENYALLADRLASVALFPTLSDGVVPLGFPIVVEERDRVRQALFAEEIYPPVHWDLEDVVPVAYSGSHWLSRHVMMLPCDQRYGPEVMEHVAERCAAAL